MKKLLRITLVLIVFLNSTTFSQSGGGRKGIEVWELDDGDQVALEPIPSKPARVRVKNLGPGHIQVYVVNESDGSYTETEMTESDDPIVFKVKPGQTIVIEDELDDEEESSEGTWTIL